LISKRELEVLVRRGARLGDDVADLKPPSHILHLDYIQLFSYSAQVALIQRVDYH